jgi:hypothetical protein
MLLLTALGTRARVCAAADELDRRDPSPAVDFDKAGEKRVMNSFVVPASAA